MNDAITAALLGWAICLSLLLLSILHHEVRRELEEAHWLERQAASHHANATREGVLA